MTASKPANAPARHLLLVAETIPDDGIGSGPIFWRHLRRLADDCWTVHIISHFPAPAAGRCFWRHTIVPPRQRWWPPVRRRWRASVRLRTLLERRQLQPALADLPATGVVVVTQLWDDISLLAVSLARERGWPLGVFHHDDEIGWETDPALQGYLHWKRAIVSTAAGRIWPVSHQLADQLPPAARARCRVLRPICGSYDFPVPTWREIGSRGLRVGYAGKMYGAFQQLLLAMADRLATHGGTLELITDPENAALLHQARPNLNARPFLPAEVVTRWLRDNCSVLLVAHPLDFSTVSPRWQILRSSFPSKLLEAAQVGLPLLLIGAADSAFGAWAAARPGAPFFDRLDAPAFEAGLRRLTTAEGWEAAAAWTKALAADEFNPARLHRAWAADLEELLARPDRDASC